MRLLLKLTQSSLLFYIALFFSFSILIGFTIKTNWMERIIKQLEVRILQQDQDLEYSNAVIEDFQDIFKTVISLDSKWLNPETKLLSEEGEQSFLRDHVLDSPKIIFRYSSKNCDVCVEKEIILLKELIEEIGMSNVILVANYETSRNLYAFKRLNDLSYDIYNCEDFGLGIDGMSVPYYIIMNSLCQIEKFFIPQNQYPELTQAFYSSYKEMINPH